MWTAFSFPAASASAALQGMVHAITYAREKKIPFFGICLGMQCATIEYARQVSKLDRADSTEFDPCDAQSRDLQAARAARRGRNGRHDAPGRVALQARAGLVCRTRPTAQTEISERHRHRYEFNCEYEETLTRAGFRITGRTPDGVYVEIVEVPDHPWFVGCQFHPEFKSKPLAPHPLFAAFIRASVENRRQRLGMSAEAHSAETRVRAADSAATD